MTAQKPATSAAEGSPRAARDIVVVFDFGSQVSRLIVRRLRAIGVYSELLACTATVEEVTQARPAAVVLSGGPSSVYEEGAPHIRRDVWNLLLRKKFHPEVTHTPCGAALLRNFAQRIARLELTWNMQHFLPEQIQRLKEQVGSAPVVGALSGGVDSTVAAALLHKAIGDSFHGFLIDTGLLRKNEAADTLVALRECFPSLDIECIDASAKFYAALDGVTDPEKKRKIIGALFIEVFEDAVKQKNLNTQGTYLLQGTLYPDVIESKSYKGPSHTIKTHHNVGGLPERMHLQVLEPLRDLFKDEVRVMGRALGLPEERIERHPFPGPGLAVRIIGAITPQRVKVLQEADAIFIQEIVKAGLYKRCERVSRGDRVSGGFCWSWDCALFQAFAVLLPECQSVGVMGDGRTYEATCALRAVETSDFMTADWFRMPLDVLAVASSRITNEVRGINRVVYDISSKPPATIEWE
ncbi:bifunctional gmp synthase glutamine amidotransferase protein [Cyclospora cayetanensis]|uniref:GMP synthase (glutamine-hydrolyzing) n=1 Tax=Cyclospora cayetanensis TaxID=88456 RepID=A0A1D3D896_9EIME|nr:bifunctional gmp synthase glutamine amidotransferase protein [Cyclospora cayetanensis]